MIDTLFYAAIVLQLLDVATTWYALTKISGTYEANGIMAKVMAKIGLVPTLLIKLAIAGGILFWVRDSEHALIILGLACAVYVLIVGNNIKVIRDNK